MGSSDVTLAAQRGNKHGTFSIEVLATPLIEKEVWERFKIDFTSAMIKYTDYDGSPLNVRPHWAKEWSSHVIVNGKKIDAVQYWQEKFKPAIKEFLDDISNLTKGVTVQDIRKQFSNGYYDQLIFNISKWIFYTFLLKSLYGSPKELASLK